MGSWPALPVSMIDSRRWPRHVFCPSSLISDETHAPSSSRPRCSIAVIIAPIRASGSVEISPAIPHILFGRNQRLSPTFIHILLQPDDMTPIVTHEHRFNCDRL